MSKLYLYTVFHANLQYSSIPEDQYSAIIDLCYWPVISLLDKYKISLGLEFPAYTLEKINQIDGTFLQILNNYRDKGKCEIIGSGYSQNIFPLIPCEANAKNLLLGNQIYRNYLGEDPKIAYVNEQVYSAGLPKLYIDAGYEALILDWHNSVASSDFPDDYKYQTLWLKGIDQKAIKLIWNNSISFQRFQRYIQGEISIDEYLAYLMSHFSDEADRVFPLYASDWEIFNPDQDVSFNKEDPGNNEKIQRLDDLFASLESLAEIDIISPSRILQLLPPKNEIQIGNTEFPITAKKQAKYNVTRWAVCGRDNARINAQCLQSFHRLSLIETLSKCLDSNRRISTERINGNWFQLCYLWGSDFRSFTTEEKYLEFRNKMGFLLGDLEKALNDLSSNVKVIDDFALFNPRETTWQNTAYEFNLQLEPGKHYGTPTVCLDNEPLITQAEDIRYYRDKSIRSARFVICPTIPPLSFCQGKVVPKAQADQEIGWHLENNSVRTKEVQVDFLNSRGGNIKNLFFPHIYDLSLAGTISHDFYDEIGFSTDQYTAHTIIQEREFKKITDLCPATLAFPQVGTDYPLRVPVKCKVSIPNVDLFKTYFIYTNEPRIDIKYDFRISDLSPYFFRTGILTINPEAFDQERLRYSTVNGGESVEEFFVNNKKINQTEIIDARFSASHCLGASEGWVDISDDHKGLTITTNRRKLYSAPLLHYQETKKSFYLRVYNSFCETDETTRQYWRGHSGFEVTYLGHRNEIQEARRKSQMINDGLLLITK